MLFFETWITFEPNTRLYVLNIGNAFSAYLAQFCLQRFCLKVKFDNGRFVRKLSGLWLWTWLSTSQNERSCVFIDNVWSTSHVQKWHVIAKADTQYPGSKKKKKKLGGRILSTKKDPPGEESFRQFGTSYVIFWNLNNFRSEYRTVVFQRRVGFVCCLYTFSSATVLCENKYWQS
jgi:hypothetical protein